MSVKRQAHSELNHDNWDDDEPADDKEMGQFKTASKDVLEKRVIRTAKRKNPVASEASKSVFSGFGGFNKAQPSSFDFLADLTNGRKSTNGSTGTSNFETSAKPGLFTNKPAAPNSGLFGVQTPAASLSSQPKTLMSPFGSSTNTSPSTLFSTTKVDSAKETPVLIDSTKSTSKTTSSVFGVSSTSANDSKQLFTAKNSTPFKIQPTSNTNTAMVQTSFGITTTPKATSVTPEKKSDDSEKSNEKKIKYFSKLRGLNEAVSEWISKHVAQTPLCILSPIFKDYEKYVKEITEEYQSDNKEEPDNMDVVKAEIVQNTKTSPFASNKTGSSPFTSSSSNEKSKTSMPFGASNSSTSPSKFGTPKQDNKTSTPFAMNDTGSSSLAGQKMPSPFAVNDTGSSQFKSQDIKTSPFAVGNTGSSLLTTTNTKTSSLFGSNNISSPSLDSQEAKKSTLFGINNSSPFNSSPKNATTQPLDSAKNSLIAPSPENKQPSFSFGINASTSNASSASTPSTGFSFGVTSSAASATTSPLSQSTNATSNQTSSAPFSFGIGKPFSFSASTVQQPSSESAATEKEEEPPKVEYTPVKEENSVYEKKCKMFVKKEGNFVDKGVGTLYVKKIEGSAKHQLLVRANTNLGTVLLNLVLAEAIPIQMMGKNNVMLVCIPTPDSKPPPTPVLIRVKSGEEADELLQTLNKYKA